MIKKKKLVRKTIRPYFCLVSDVLADQNHNAIRNNKRIINQ
jgi:hypothetical protein